jgi:hypothetical protein
METRFDKGQTEIVQRRFPAPFLMCVCISLYNASFVEGLHLSYVVTHSEGY